MMESLNALCLECTKVDGGSDSWSEVWEFSSHAQFYLPAVFSPLLHKVLIYKKKRKGEEKKNKTQNKKENGISSSVSPYKLVRL